MKIFYKDKEINEAANEVIKLMPSLEPFYSSNERLSEYSRRINIYKPHKIHLQRQAKFKQILREKINSIFNEEELKKIDIKLDENSGIVSGIVDHHGIMDHPLLLSVTLVSNFYKLFSKKENGDILTFATSNISLNEPFRRRGIRFHTKKINLFPKSDKEKVIRGLKKYDLDIIKILQKKNLLNDFSKDEQSFLENISQIINKIDFSTCKYLGDQITKINFHLWPLLFEKTLRKKTANLVSLEDDFVVDYLIYVLKNDKESFISKMLFDKKFCPKTIDWFEGIPGAWDDKKNVGTHFFWALDENNERIHLRLKNNYLVGINKKYKIPFDLDSLIPELQSKKLIPGMILKFSLILFYMGMKPLAGWSLEYLTRMKAKMIELLKNDFSKEVELIDKIPLDNMNLISLCKEKINGTIKDLNAFDVFYKGGFDKKYFKKLDSIPFKDFMTPSILEAYDYAVSKYGDSKNKKEFQLPDAKLQKVFEKLF